MTPQLDDLLAGLVRGDAVDVRALSAIDAAAFCERAGYHGVLPLVANRLATVDELAGDLKSALRGHARSAIAADLVRAQSVTTALGALSTAGVDPLVLKGEQLAHRWYERPDLRPRLDTDLLIAQDSRTRAADVLKTLGYEPAGHVTGALVNYQATFIKRRQHVKVHAFDVHWRVANPQVFAGLLTYDELLADAMAIPGLGPHGRGPSAPAALLLACVHRVAHHFDSGRLIWLYDIHLIASTLAAAEWARFLDLALSRRVAAICARSLDRAAAEFGTCIPAAIAEDARLRAPQEREASAAYMMPGRSQMQNLADDLQALPTWRHRLQLMREHLFPSPQYMREVYALSSRAPLPLLYATRALRGARRWLERIPVNDASRIR
jgi:putative nucleotidyltransferase-like protein